MDWAANLIKRFFDISDEMQAELSERWRRNGNRRTILLLLVIGCAGAYIYLNAIRPPADFPAKEIVTVPSGENLRAISETLEEDGIVRSALMFRAMTILLGHEHDLRAGDYIFKTPLDVFQIARAIGIGAYGLEPIKITIPDGTTVAQMSTIYAALLPHFNAQNFVAEAQPLEGFLYPDTYYFLPNATETTVIEAMRQDFDTQELSIQPQIEAFGQPLENVVIMASIVESEAGNTQDRRTIAGVLWNRIAKGMPLQADVTLVYELGKGDFQLTRQDLQADTPYNTYVRKGLPPTPINSPGLDALKAAVTPVKSNYLYYMADKNGVTHYCATYACQAANQKEYLGN